MESSVILTGGPQVADLLVAKVVDGHAAVHIFATQLLAPPRGGRASSFLAVGLLVDLLPVVLPVVLPVGLLVGEVAAGLASRQ